MSILDRIVEAAKLRVQREKLEQPQPVLQIKRILPAHSFEKALQTPEMSFICEVKKASPSKGVIAEDFPYTQIAKEYEAGGAAAISVLTEPDFFLGKNQYLTEIRKEVHIPLLRKDFIIDPYQIEQAFCIGADAVLLIAAVLDIGQLQDYINYAESLGLSCLVEAHDENEVKIAQKAGARIIGVNNRDLRTFSVDLSNSISLRKLVSEDTIFVAESGIKTSEDIKKLHENKIDAVLIGETLMRSKDKRAELEKLWGKNPYEVI